MLCLYRDRHHFAWCGGRRILDGDSLLLLPAVFHQAQQSGGLVGTAGGHSELVGFLGGFQALGKLTLTRVIAGNQLVIVGRPGEPGLRFERILKILPGGFGFAEVSF